MASQKVTVTGRLINNAIFTPKVDETYGKENYSALLVLDEGQEAKIKAAYTKAVNETFDGKPPANLQDWTVREGDDEEYELTFGKKFINAKHTRKPRTVARMNGDLVDISADEGLLYAGCYVAVSIDVYAYKKNSEKKIPAGVSLGLRAVMFKAHGEPLSSGGVSDDEFDGFESDDDMEF